MKPPNINVLDDILLDSFLFYVTGFSGTGYIYLTYKCYFLLFNWSLYRYVVTILSFGFSVHYLYGVSFSIPSFFSLCFSWWNEFLHLVSYFALLCLFLLITPSVSVFNLGCPIHFHPRLSLVIKDIFPSFCCLFWLFYISFVLFPLICHCGLVINYTETFNFFFKCLLSCWLLLFFFSCWLLNFYMVL